MPRVPELVDLACAVHVHSTYSDGTGTVPEIAAAGARAGVDAVLLTDHDTLEARDRGKERWYGSTLVCVGEEVSPPGRNHFLAFGLEEPIEHAGLDSQGIVDAVARAGGFGFLAHPFSRGSQRFRRLADGMPWEDLDAAGFTGIELWSFVTDTAEALTSVAGVMRFVASPGRVLDHPPRRNMAEWDRLAARRAVVAIGGLDAHQFGRRVAGRIPVRLMSYHRSFRYVRTHVLVDGPPTGDAARDRDGIYAALRAGRCYAANDALAPARGFSFWAERPGGAGRLEMGVEEAAGRPVELHVRAPARAALRLVRDGATIAATDGTGLDHSVSEPGVYRVEALRAAHGRIRTWVVSNPIYLR